MVKVKKQNELEIEIEKLKQYCEEQDIPIFIAVWDKSVVDEKNDGYVFGSYYVGLPRNNCICCEPP